MLAAWVRLFVTLSVTSLTGCGPVFTSTCLGPHAVAATARPTSAISFFIDAPERLVGSSLSSLSLPLVEQISGHAPTKRIRRPVERVDYSIRIFPANDRASGIRRSEQTIESRRIYG